MARAYAGSDAARMPKHYTPSQRTELIRSVTTQHAPVRAAASRLGVTESTAYRWLRDEGARPTPAASRPPTFARLVPAAAMEARLHLRIGEVEVDVRPGFDAALLRAVVAALTEGAA